MNRSVTPYRYTILSLVAAFLCLAGCSSWHVEPKELIPIQVFTYDLVTTSASKWTVTFALGGNPSDDPEKALTDVGVCYSQTSQTPEILKNEGLVAARRPVLPTSISVVVTEKATYYFRAYVTLTNGTTLYSRTGTFITQ